MRTSEELIAAWRDVAALSSKVENDNSLHDRAMIRARVEDASAWLREQAEGYGASSPAFRIETIGKRWSPCFQLAAYRAQLPELAALGRDVENAFGLIGEITDALVRDLVAADYIAILAASGLFERAQTATNFLKFIHPQIRCKALLAIASASHEPSDLFAASSSADRLTSIDKVRAYLDIYGLTRVENDLLLARNAATHLEPPERLIACEHIALATSDAEDYVRALGAAESIINGAARLEAITGVLAAIASGFLLEGKNAISKKTLRTIVANPMLDKYPFWKKSALELLGENN